MSLLGFFESKVEEVRQQAKQEGRSFISRKTQIEQDPDLSDSARQRELQELVSDTNTRLHDLFSKENKLIEDEIANVERRLDGKVGGTSADVIASRDAQDRAERLEDAAEAERVMTRALRTEDQSLAYAVFRRAVEANYRTVISLFGNAHPELRDTVGELAYLHAARGQRLERAFRYMKASL